jgi:chromosome segregation ATPase
MADGRLLKGIQDLVDKMKVLESEKREAVARVQELEREKGQAAVKIEELEHEVGELGALIALATEKVTEALKEGATADI